jgi:OmpA-OmpF porin, OOP family
VRVSKFFGERFQKLVLNNMKCIYQSICVIALILIFPFTGAQNLVPNPGFEIYKKCPCDYTISYRKQLIPGWFLPTKGTSDYFNSCAKFTVSVPQNFMGYCLPEEGQAYAGIIVLEDPPVNNNKTHLINYREYLQSKLITPLINNQLYLVKFYFSIAPYSTFSINRLGAYISKKKIGKRYNSKVLSEKPQIYMDTSIIMHNCSKWYTVSDTFCAKGGEEYLTIGNFYDDIHTKYETLELPDVAGVLKAKIRQNRIAYYYIDLVSITLISTKKINSVANQSTIKVFYH